MNFQFSRTTRAIVIVGVLAIAALGAGFLVLGRHQDSSDAAPPVTTDVSPLGGSTLTTKAHPRRPPAASTPTTSTPTATAPAVRRRRARAATPGAPVLDRLPAAIQQGLNSNHVVVVSLYDPTAKIDDTAMREAQAGAQLAGAMFAPIDVTKNEVDSLNAHYGVIQDPAVLVLRPPGELVLRIDGFADRDTVAQAAANAAS